MFDRKPYVSYNVRMKILLLSPYPERLMPFLVADSVTVTADKVSPEFMAGFDLGISYGYRHILKAEHLAALPCINLHISYLPWNRGADPNLWSWIDNTPKGVTIHWIDEGIDTGDIITQRMTAMHAHEMLSSSYEALHRDIVEMFAATWPAIRSGNASRIPQPKGGSLHRIADRQKVQHLLFAGFDTPVNELMNAGAHL